MIVHDLVVAGLALGAAACFAISSVIEQRKASQAPIEAALRPALLWHLARHPVWWLAIAVDIGGYGLQVLALGMGAVVFVQPLIVASLVLSLVFGAIVGSHELSRSDLGWAVLFVVSLSLFLLAANPGGGVSQRPFAAWIPAFVVVAAVVAGCVVVSRRPGLRSVALATGSGALFGVSSALTKTFADQISGDGFALLARWEVYVLAGVLAGGFFLMQSAFQAGDLRAALPAIDIGEPLVASLLGVVVLHEVLDVRGPLAVLVLGVTVVGMGWSTLRLAQSAARASEGARGSTTPKGADAAHDDRV